MFVYYHVMVPLRFPILQWASRLLTLSLSMYLFCSLFFAAVIYNDNLDLVIKSETHWCSRWFKIYTEQLLHDFEKKAHTFSIGNINSNKFTLSNWDTVQFRHRLTKHREKNLCLSNNISVRLKTSRWKKKRNNRWLIRSIIKFIDQTHTNRLSIESACRCKNQSLFVYCYYCWNGSAWNFLLGIKSERVSLALCVVLWFLWYKIKFDRVNCRKCRRGSKNAFKY